MSTAVSASMQAALLIREKQRLRRKGKRPHRPQQLPSHVATREIAPFPRYPPYFPLHGQPPPGRTTWCSQGRAAWQERERERRGSLSEAALNHRARQTEAHLRWMKRNRIHDSSYGGSSDEEDILGGLYGHQSAAANALLYVGLGTVAIGAVIFFVGTGEKGFKTLELRMIGPTLVGCGFLCCLVRILLCVCPSRCLRRRKRKRCRHHGEGSSQRYRNQCPEDFRMADHNTSLLRKQTTNKKRVSIAPGARPVPSTSQCNNIATTSLFLQNEQDTNLVPKLIPTIGIPHLIEVSDASDLNRETRGRRLPRPESVIELQNLAESDLYEEDLSSVSSDDNVGPTTTCTVDVNTSAAAQSKMNRKREPVHGGVVSTTAAPTAAMAETSLTIAPAAAVTAAEDAQNGLLFAARRQPPTPPPPKQHPGELVLSPSKLGQ